MGTCTVAWKPLPLPCLCAGVRKSRATMDIPVLFLHRVDVLSRNSSTPTSRTPGSLAPNSSRAVTKSRPTSALVRKMCSQEMHWNLSKRPSLTQSVELSFLFSWSFSMNVVSSFPTCCDLPWSRCTFPVQFANFVVTLRGLVCLNPMYIRESNRSHCVGDCCSNEWSCQFCCCCFLACVLAKCHGDR